MRKGSSKSTDGEILPGWGQIASNLRRAEKHRGLSFLQALGPEFQRLAHRPTCKDSSGQQVKQKVLSYSSQVCPVLQPGAWINHHKAVCAEHLYL